MFYFLAPIPPKVPHVVWPRVLELLGGTLRSAVRQTGRDFRVLVSGQDYPDIAEMHDLKVEFVEAEMPRPRDASQDADDLERKVAFLRSQAEAGAASAHMVVRLGDRVNRALVTNIAVQPEAPGYLVSSGYVWNYGTAEVAPSERMFKGPLHERTSTGVIVSGRAPADGEDSEEGDGFAEIALRGAMLTVNQGLSAAGPQRSKVLDRYLGRLRRRRVTVTQDLRDEFALEGEFKREMPTWIRPLLYLRDA